MNFKLTVWTTLMFVGYHSAHASEVQYDKSIAEAAAKQAADKLGEIRPSIDFDKQPQVIAPNPDVEKEAVEEEASDATNQRITEIRKNGFQSNLSRKNETSDIDYTLTGSVERKPPVIITKVVWEKFDAEGNHLTH